MKVFWAEYYWSGPYDAYDQYNTIVVAETESVALGLLLQFVIPLYKF